jgi:hypothetical protein
MGIAIVANNPMLRNAAVTKKAINIDTVASRPAISAPVNIPAENELVCSVIALPKSALGTMSPTSATNKV